jgi:hypothetical protein
VLAAPNSRSYDAWFVSYLSAFLNQILSPRQYFFLFLFFWFTNRDVYDFHNIVPDAIAVSDPIFRSLQEVESADCCQTCEGLWRGCALPQDRIEVGGSVSRRAERR